MLGIDPGSRYTGFGVVEQRRGQLTHVGHGVIRATPQVALEVRLSEIFVALKRAVELYRPEAVAVEGLFFFKNARSALVLGHARGVALLVAAQSALPVFEYSPAKVKKAVGAGGADGKDAVGRMVRRFLQLQEVERADATDALAVAICHVNQLKGASFSGTSRAQPSRANNKLSAFEQRLAPAFQPSGGTR